MTGRCFYFLKCPATYDADHSIGKSLVGKGGTNFRPEISLLDRTGIDDADDVESTNRMLHVYKQTEIQGAKI